MWAASVRKGSTHEWSKASFTLFSLVRSPGIVKPLEMISDDTCSSRALARDSTRIDLRPSHQTKKETRSGPGRSQHPRRETPFPCRIFPEAREQGRYSQCDGEPHHTHPGPTTPRRNERNGRCRCLRRVQAKAVGGKRGNSRLCDAFRSAGSEYGWREEEQRDRLMDGAVLHL